MITRAILSAAFIFSGAVFAAANDKNAPLASIDITRVNAAVSEALSTTHPQVDLKTFYLHRVNYEMVLATSGRHDIQLISATYRLSPETEAPLLSKHQRIAGIRAELDTKGRLKRLLLVPDNAENVGVISITLPPKDEETLVQEGLLPPQHKEK